MADLCAFDDAEAMAGAAAADIATMLRAAIAARGAASLSVCGGATPGAVYRALSATDLPWDRVRVTLSDERRVPPAAEESNERLARDTLLQARAASACFVGLYRDGAPGESLSSIETALQDVPRPIDVGVLGIGEDGHTASLFPDGADHALDPAAAGRVAVVEKAGPGASLARITMTLPELAAHRTLIFLTRGMRKRAIVDAVLGIAGDPEGLPVAHVVAAADGDVRIYWAP